MFGQPDFFTTALTTFKMPEKTGKTLSKNSFNKQMKKSLFQILDNEDSYLDVENISSKLEDCMIKSN